MCFFVCLFVCFVILTLLMLSVSSGQFPSGLGSAVPQILLVSHNNANLHFHFCILQNNENI